MKPMIRKKFEMKPGVWNASFALIAALSTLFAPGAFAASTNVAASGFSFVPVSVTINSGDSVTWTGLGISHNAQTDADPFCGIPPVVGGTCTHTFDQPGTYNYYCVVHRGAPFFMVGTVIVVGAGGSPPSVTVTNPVEGAIFVAPANITIQAAATDSDGTVTNVQFFANTNAVGSATASPFSIVASNLAAGSYALTAVASDNSGLTSTSAVVNISVVAPLSVTVANPVEGAIFVAPANVSIQAAATDPNGTVTNVEFFANTNLVGSAAASPFSIVASNLAAGSYALTAVASDNSGLTSTSAVVNISVVAQATVTLSASAISNGQFQFKYTAEPGSSYLIQNSSNLFDWSAVATNMATTNVETFGETFNLNTLRFYRVGQLPNP